MLLTPLCEPAAIFTRHSARSQTTTSAPRVLGCTQVRAVTHDLVVVNTETLSTSSVSTRGWTSYHPFNSLDTASTSRFRLQETAIRSLDVQLNSQMTTRRRAAS